jgi:integrase/recombinase XerD
MPREGGYLYQRGDTWWGRVRIAGREHYASLRTTDRREAVRRLKGWRTKLERVAVGSRDHHTWEEAVIRWIEEVLPGAVKPGVAARYTVSIRQLATDFADQPIGAITGPAIGDYIGRRSREGATNATIHRDLTALSRLLASCVAWGWREDNPARQYDRSLIRERRDPIMLPTMAQLQALLAEASPGIGNVLRALHESGMREAEVLTMEANQVDWQAETVTLVKTKTSRPRVLRFKTPAADLGPVLEPLKRRSGMLFRSARDEAYSVPSFSGGVWQVMQRLLERDADFRPFRVHDLRHWFAVRWLRADRTGIYTLAQHLGHRSVKTTEVYLDHIPGGQTGGQLAAKQSGLVGVEAD